jgi:thioredoxin 1
MANVITDANFEALIKGDKPVVVDFWAEWCAPCRTIGPFVEELASEYAEKVFVGKMNVDENEETPALFGIRSIPTLLFFKEGAVVDKVVGATSKEVLNKKIKALL